METYIIDMENHLGKITEGHSAEYIKKNITNWWENNANHSH